MRGLWGTWVAQLVKCATLDLGSDLDLRVVCLLQLGVYFQKENEGFEIEGSLQFHSAVMLYKVMIP